MKKLSSISKTILLIKLSAVIFSSVAVSEGSLTPDEKTDVKRKNILFVAIDDLRTELPNYGAAHVIAPHIEKLAEQGLTFNRAYCQISICQPSRESIMVGLRADSTLVYDIDPNHTFRQTLPTVSTMPEHFARHGYRTKSLGKIFHQAERITIDSKHLNKVNAELSFKKIYRFQIHLKPRLSGFLISSTFQIQ